MTVSVGKLTLAMYPLGAGAMAVNCFFVSLIGRWFGLPVLSTLESVVIGSIVAVPLTWLFARHIQKLMLKAGSDPGDADH